MKLAVNDTILVTIGKDKGRQGKIIKTIPEKNSVLVEGINVYKRHRKPAMGIAGGIIDRPRSLNIGKVALICPNCKVQTRVGYQVENQIKQRFCKKCKKIIS